jgi:hypothetical protein
MESSMTASSKGVRWAYLGMGIGGVASILANIAHACLPDHPPAGSVIAAAFWPVALFVTIEILAKNAWPSAARWTLLRWGGTLPVAAVTAVVSYRHMSGLLAAWGEDPLTATIGPIAVDGLLVMSTGAIIAAGARIAAPAPVSEPLPIPVAEPTPIATPVGIDVTDSKPAARNLESPPVKPAAAHRVRTATDAELAEVIAGVLQTNRKAGRDPVIVALKERGLTPGKTERLTTALAAQKRQGLHAVTG